MNSAAEIRLDQEGSKHLIAIRRLIESDIKEWDDKQYIRYGLSERLKRIEQECHALLNLCEDIAAREKKG